MDELAALNTEIVAVSVDTVETSRRMSDDLGLTFAIAADPKRRLTKLLGIYDEPNDIAWPAVFIVSPAGKIEWRDVASSYVLEKRPTVERLVEVVRALEAKD